MRRGLLLVALAAMLVCASAASAAAPSHGARYDGPGTKRDTTKLVVSKSGTRLAAYRLPAAMSCSNHKRRYTYLMEKREGPARIDAAGSFSYTSPSEKGTIRYRKGRIKAVFKSMFSGRFQSPDVVTGQITTTLKTSKYSCKGTFAFRAFRDGTPGAPFRNSLLATGRYRASGRGVKIANMRLLAPGAEVRDGLRIKTTSRCRPRGSLTSPFNFHPLVLRHGRLNLVGRFRTRVGRLPSRERIQLKLHFYRRGSAYLLRGSVRDTLSAYRHHRRVYRCDGTRRFKGHFVDGPQ